MLNYLGAELWRMFHRRQWLALYGGCLALVLLAAVLWGNGTQARAVETLRDLLAAGLYLCFPLAGLTAGDLWRNGTLGNEISCGLPRARIYVGKFLASLAVAVVLLALMLGLYLVVMLALADRSGAEELLSAWRELGRGLAVALPRYLGALSLAHALCFTLRTGGLAPVLYYLYLTIGELFLGAIHAEGLGLLGVVLNTLAGAARPILLTGGFYSYGAVGGSPAGPIQSWLVGLGWLLITTAVGWRIFSRREVK